MTIQERYRRWRKLLPNTPANVVMSMARAEERQAAILDRFGEWTFKAGEYGAFAQADMPAGEFTIRVLIGDDDIPTEWGDIEPTGEEREASSSYSVAVQVLTGVRDDEPLSGDEVYHDGISGIDVIDLPGYLQRDWEDAAAYALDEYLLAGAEKFALNERRERDYWAACDVVTV